ncbi:hypothetical protein ACLOJK_018037 [Asimina triloba]
MCPASHRTDFEEVMPLLVAGCAAHQAAIAGFAEAVGPDLKLLMGCASVMMQRLPKFAGDAPYLAVAALFYRGLQPDLPMGRRGFAAVELAFMDVVWGKEGVVHHAVGQTWLDLPLELPNFKSKQG